MPILLEHSHEPKNLVRITDDIHFALC
jgi:hypothetical protein